MAEADFALTSLVGPALGAAALTAALTWLARVIGHFLQQSDNRRLAQRKRRGLAVVLRTEIRVRVASIDEFGKSINLDIFTKAAMATHDYYPFTTPDGRLERRLYADLRGDLVTLEGQVLEAVFRFYEYDDKLQRMVEDLRSEDFRLLAAERKIAYMKLLKTSVDTTIDEGHEALKLLDAFID